MTTLWIILTFVLVVGAGVATIVLRLLKHAAPITPDDILAPGRSAGESYRPMQRLFSPGDFAFLGDQPELRRGLRLRRIRVMRLYLRQLRADFVRVYALARALAPTSLDPSFASGITLQAIRFHGLMLLVEARCAVGWFAPVHVNTGGLVELADQLRQTVRVSLLAMQPAGATI
jgi:hypothetical protein